jgi:hypothetical protein
VKRPVRPLMAKVMIFCKEVPGLFCLKKKEGNGVRAICAGLSACYSVRKKVGRGREQGFDAKAFGELHARDPRRHIAANHKATANDNSKLDADRQKQAWAILFKTGIDHLIRDACLHMPLHACVRGR